MKAALLPVLLGLAACGQGGAARLQAQAHVTPVQKVVQLLQGMLDKAEEEKHQEALQFAGFSQFCSDVTAEKSKAITEADEEIELLRAKIQGYLTEADRLALEIKGHIAEVTQLDNDTQAAIVVRHEEREEYLAMHANYTESLHALDKAISSLKAQAYDREGADPSSAALLQKVQAAVALPQAKSRLLQAFLSESQDPDLTFQPPPVPTVPTSAYEFRSDDIVKMLEDLEVRFRDEMHALEAAEVSRQNAYNVLTQDLKASSDAAETARGRKATSKAKSAQMASAAEGELGEVQKERNDDFKYLTDLNQTCVSKSAEFASREALRAEEISALAKAVEILSADAVAGAAAKHLPAAALLRVRKQALLQLRSADAPSQAALRAAGFLRDASQRLHSTALAALAVRANDDPFGKVRQLIEELIKRLMQEATEEAEHKGWCDTELATNGHTRKTKTEEIELLRSEIDGLNANVAQLAKDLTELVADIAAIEAAVAEATDLRQNETAANNATVAEARAAQGAVADATKVLKDFYAKAAQATVLAQRQEPTGGREAPPPIFDDAYQGLQSERGGVLGMLEVIAADFARLERDTLAAEGAATAEYNSFMEDSSVSKAQKDSGIRHKEGVKRQKEQTLSEKSDSLLSAEQVLTIAEGEFEKLQPACINTGQTYEERVTRRKDEIEALKEALRILSGEDS